MIDETNIILLLIIIKGQFFEITIGYMEIKPSELSKSVIKLILLEISTEMCPTPNS